MPNSLLHTLLSFRTLLLLHPWMMIFIKFLYSPAEILFESRNSLLRNQLIQIFETQRQFKRSTGSSRDQNPRNDTASISPHPPKRKERRGGEDKTSKEKEERNKAKPTVRRNCRGEIIHRISLSARSVIGEYDILQICMKAIEHV